MRLTTLSSSSIKLDSVGKNGFVSSNNLPPSHFKPGKTQHDHERHYVIHRYTDYANEPNDPAMEPIRRRKGGVMIPFPI